MDLMTGKEITAMVDSIAAPKPPVGAADHIKLAWLQVELLRQIALQNAYRLAYEGVFPPLNPPGQNTTLDTM